MTGVADVQSRVLSIQSTIAALAPRPVANREPVPAAAATSSATTFAGALDEALAATGGTAAPATARTAAAGPAAGPAGPAAGPDGEAVVAAARRYLGVPYVWGGTDPAKGLDCSGLVQRVYADLGIDLPRVSRDQAREGRAVASLAEARPGDLLAFDNSRARPGVDHIAIYIGGGRMIEAPRPGRDVRVADVPGTPVAIRRILPDQGAGAAAAPARATGGSAGDGLPAAADPYVGLFRAAGARHGVPPELLAAVAEVESGFRADAVSPAGARGLMQIMPGTARELGVDPMVPAQAVDGAARLLRSHLRAFGSTELALAAYNAGPGAVRRYDGIPPYAETRGYVRKVTAALEEISL